MSEEPQRWSRATVHADMWVDPDDDPRNTGGVSPDGELATLMDYLRSYRLTLAMKCEGLNADQLARRSVPPSTLSLLGLVRHLARVEQTWGQRVLAGDHDLPRHFDGEGEGPEFDGALPDPALVDEAFRLWEQESSATDAVVAKFEDLGARVPLPDSDHQIAVREVLVHLIEEYARHCGHADLLREAIDGRVGQ